MQIETVKRSVLVTRPQPAAAELAARLQREGFTVFISPLLHYVPVAAPLDALANCQAIVFTSPQGVEAFAKTAGPRTLPAFAVGASTASACRDAGFAVVHTAEGDGMALARLIRARKQEICPAAGPCTLFHAAGEDTAQDLRDLLTNDGITVHRAVFYRAETVPALTQEVISALRDGRITTVTLFSARTASHFVNLLNAEGLQAATAPLEAACLSPRIAAELQGVPFRAVRTARAPTVEALLDILRSAGPASSGPGMPAEAVIAAFGGLRPLANRLKITASTVQGWKKRGIIPDQRAEAVIAAAREDGIDLDRLWNNAPAAPGKKGRSPMTDERGKDDNHPAQPPMERRRGPDRRKQKPVFDSRGYVHTPTYVGPDRRTGVDRRAFQERRQQSIRQEKWRFLNRTVITAAFFFIAIAYGAAFLLAPEFFQMREDAARIRDMEEEMQRLNERLLEMQQKQSSAATPSLGGRLHQTLESIEQTTSGVATTVSNIGRAAKGEISAEAAGIGGVADRMQQLVHVLTTMNLLESSEQGKAAASGIMTRLKKILAQSPSTGDGLNKALESARKTDPELNALLGRIDTNELGAAALLLALNELRGNINTNQSFEEDLLLLQKFAGQDPEMQRALKRLAPHAKSGVLSRENLQQEFKSVASDIVMAKLQGEDLSVKQEVLKRMSNLVKVRRVDDVKGDSVDAVVARAQLLLDRGDVRGAMAELKTLEGAPADTAASFMQQADGHLAAEATSDALLQAIVQQLSSSSGFSLDSFMPQVMEQIQGPQPVPYLSPSLQE